MDYKDNIIQQMEVVLQNKTILSEKLKKSLDIAVLALLEIKLSSKGQYAGNVADKAMEALANLGGDDNAKDA